MSFSLAIETPEDIAAKARETYVAAIKKEAARRIVETCPEWKQRNLIVQASILAEKGRANWTEGDQAAWEAQEAIWRRIDEIRAASDRLEAAPGTVADLGDDALWV